MNNEQQPFQPLTGEPVLGSPLPPLAPSPPSPPSPKWSAGEILVGVISSPLKTMAYVGENKPLKLGLGTYLGVLLFSGVISMLTWQNRITPEQSEIFSQAFGEQFSDFFSVFMGISYGAAFFIGVLSIFMLAAIYNLLGELFDGQPNAKGILAGLGLAQLPGILIPPFQLLPSSTLSTILLAVVGIIVGLWGLVLQVMVVRFAMKLSWGKAIAVYILPLIVLFIMVMGFIIAMFAMMAGTIANMPY